MVWGVFLFFHRNNACWFFCGVLVQGLNLCISITCLTIILKITVRHYYACFVAHSNSCYPFNILVSNTVNMPPYQAYNTFRLMFSLFFSG